MRAGRGRERLAARASWPSRRSLPARRRRPGWRSASSSGLICAKVAAAGSAASLGRALRTGSARVRPLLVGQRFGRLLLADEQHVDPHGDERGHDGEQPARRTRQRGRRAAGAGASVGCVTTRDAGLPAPAAGSTPRAAAGGADERRRRGDAAPQSTPRRRIRWRGRATLARRRSWRPRTRPRRGRRSTPIPDRAGR